MIPHNTGGWLGAAAPDHLIIMKRQWLAVGMVIGVVIFMVGIFVGLAIAREVPRAPVIPASELLAPSPYHAIAMQILEDRGCERASPYGWRLAVEAQRQGIEPHIGIWARQLWAESWCSPDAVSSAGAEGLMQLLPASRWPQRFPTECGGDPFDGTQNIICGMRVNAHFLELCGGRIVCALNRYVGLFAHIGEDPDNYYVRAIVD